MSLRWLAAVVLTGVAGATLIGGAIYSSLDGETSFAEPPERALTPSVTASDAPSFSRRGDKLVRTEFDPGVRQNFRTPTSVRVGNRDIVRTRPFVRLATNLTLTPLGFARDTPAFNPMRLFAEASSAERIAAEPEQPPAEGDLSLARSPLADLTFQDTDGPTIDATGALAQVEEERRAAATPGRSPALPLPGDLLLSRALRAPSEIVGESPVPLSLPGQGALFSSIEVRMVPENVTTIPKRELDPRSLPRDERVVPFRASESIEAALRGAGVPADRSRAAAAALRPSASQAAGDENLRLSLLFVAPAEGEQGPQFVRARLYAEARLQAVAAYSTQAPAPGAPALAGSGSFVAVAPAEAEAPPRRPRNPANEDDDDGEGIRLFNAIYETALKHEIPRSIVDEFIRVTFYDVDMQRRVSAGDSMELFLSEDEEAGPGEPRFQLLYAALTTGGELKRYYRFQGEDGAVEFFNDQGKSSKKFLISKPIEEGEFRSGFGFRRHPVLGYSRMHNGVDWSNRIGTRIFAAGAGQVGLSGWSSGYGNRVEIEHANGYTTTYSHLSAFGPGIREGARVRQGQVIGFVGSTGLSTGPHLHYEVLINGRHVDPMRIRLPRARELDGRAIVEFRRQRDRVDGLMEKAPGAPQRLARTASN